MTTPNSIVGDQVEGVIIAARKAAEAFEALIEHTHEDQGVCCELGSVLGDVASSELNALMQSLLNYDAALAEGDKS